MKYTKILAVMCAAVLGISMVAGCGTTTESASEETTAELETTEKTSGDEVEEKADTDMVYGQITAIDGDTITIALAEKPEMDAKPEMGEKPDMTDGSTEMPQNGDKPEGDAPKDGEAPADGEFSTENMGEKPEGGMEQNLTLTGETKEITITDSTKITVDGEEKTMDTLAVDDVINVEMDGDTVISISSGRMSMPDGEAPTDKASDETTETK